MGNYEWQVMVIDNRYIYPNNVFCILVCQRLCNLKEQNSLLVHSADNDFLLEYTLSKYFQ